MKKDDIQAGFTLVELMVAMVISIIVVGAIYVAYISQQRTYIAQDAVAEMQQNLRAAMTVMEMEIRMAGFDPTGKAGAGITTAKRGQISFTMDIDDDGDTNDPNEQIDYGFSPADDANRDGVPDAAGQALSLGRKVGAAGYQPIADNIQAVEFNYILDDGTSSTDPSMSDYNRIREIQVSILARAGRVDRNFTNTMTYTSAGGQTWGPYNDNYRRRLLIANLQCRNLGM